jgi:LacI family transcriptional regulator
VATIQDIADRAGVSIGTVSRVLNAKPDVSPSTRERIRRVMAELDYRPSGLARGLATQKSRVIGFLAADFMNPNFPELARGVVDQAGMRGYSVMFFDTRRDIEMERRAAHILEAEHVAGVVAPILEEVLDDLDRLHHQRLPVVRIYRDASMLDTPLVALDNVRAGELATEHLIRLGHRRIAYLKRASDPVSDRERETGYRRALETAGIGVHEELIAHGALTRESAAERMARLLSLHDPPTAVFASKDVLAIGAYDAIIESGLSIPEDISVVGHDDIEASRLVRPQLTTLTTNRHRLGEAAVDMLFQQIDGDENAETERVFTAELVVRRSTAPPRVN